MTTRSKGKTIKRKKKNKKLESMNKPIHIYKNNETETTKYLDRQIIIVTTQILT